MVQGSSPELLHSTVDFLDSIGTPQGYLPRLTGAHPQAQIGGRAGLKLRSPHGHPRALLPSLAFQEGLHSRDEPWVPAPDPATSTPPGGSCWSPGAPWRQGGPSDGCRLMSDRNGSFVAFWLCVSLMCAFIYAFPCDTQPALWVVRGGAPHRNRCVELHLSLSLSRHPPSMVLSQVLCHLSVWLREAKPITSSRTGVQEGMQEGGSDSVMGH